MATESNNSAYQKKNKHDTHTRNKFCFGSTTVGRIYDRNLLWNCEEHQRLRISFIGFQRSLWKFSTTGNLYSLKSWLWLAVVACVVRWPISNALLNDIWIACFTRMYIWNETTDTNTVGLWPTRSLVISTSVNSHLFIGQFDPWSIRTSIVLKSNRSSVFFAPFFVY